MLISENTIIDLSICTCMYNLCSSTERLHISIQEEVGGERKKDRKNKNNPFWQNNLKLIIYTIVLRCFFNDWLQLWQKIRATSIGVY